MLGTALLIQNCVQDSDVIYKTMFLSFPGACKKSSNGTSGGYCRITKVVQIDYKCLLTLTLIPFVINFCSLATTEGTEEHKMKKVSM